jgi:hypothetical protein
MEIGTMTPEQWIVEGEVGTSSKTIWAVMMGVVKGRRQCDWHYDTPKDPDDFKRCWNLIVAIPEWRARLHEVAQVFPKWQPFIREWDKLEAMLVEHLVAMEQYQGLPPKEQKQFKFTDGMYEFMQVLDREAMLLDGWIEDSPGCYHRD